MGTKSTTPTATATKTPAPAAAPAAPADGQTYNGRINPLSAIMRMVAGKQPNETESSELAKFVSGLVRLTDSHIYALARFFEKRYHVQLSTLALKIARYQADQDETLSVQAAKAAIEDLIGVQLADYDPQEGVYTNEFERYLTTQVKAAHEAIWAAYGKDGNLDPGLITRANAYDAEIRANRQAQAAE